MFVIFSSLGSQMMNDGEKSKKQVFVFFIVTDIHMVGSSCRPHSSYKMQRDNNLSSCDHVNVFAASVYCCHHSAPHSLLFLQSSVGCLDINIKMLVKLHVDQYFYLHYIVKGKQK